eukprot:m.256929 g.256929  ORF g.256929 m.256929 type:complete len:64 (+) comp34839_c0_seq1:111-302(+)
MFSLFESGVWMFMLLLLAVGAEASSTNTYSSSSAVVTFMIAFVVGLLFVEAGLFYKRKGDAKA